MGGRAVGEAGGVGWVVAVDLGRIVEVVGATPEARSADFTGAALAALSSFAVIQLYVGVRHMMVDTVPLVARSTVPPVRST